MIFCFFFFVAVAFLPFMLLNLPLRLVTKGNGNSNTNPKENDFTLTSQLFAACKTGDLDTVQQIITKHPDLNKSLQTPCSKSSNVIHTDVTIRTAIEIADANQQGIIRQWLQTYPVEREENKPENRMKRYYAEKHPYFEQTFKNNVYTNNAEQIKWKSKEDRAYALQHVYAFPCNGFLFWDEERKYWTLRPFGIWYYFYVYRENTQPVANIGTNMCDGIYSSIKGKCRTNTPPLRNFCNKFIFFILSYNFQRCVSWINQLCGLEPNPNHNTSETCRFCCHHNTHTSTFSEFDSCPNLQTNKKKQREQRDRENAYYWKMYIQNRRQDELRKQNKYKPQPNKNNNTDDDNGDGDGHHNKEN